jgi:hypothetical protein
MKTYRPYSALFTSSPHMQAFAAMRKEDTALYVLRVSEYDTATRRMEPRDIRIQGHWDAARWAVEHTTKTLNVVTAYEDGDLDTPIWKTFLRQGNVAAIGAYGASEKKNPRHRNRATRAEADLMRRRATDPNLRARTEPLAQNPPVFTQAQKRAAIEHLLTPRLVTVEDTQQAKAQARTISKEEKAQLIADLLKPRLADQS